MQLTTTGQCPPSEGPHGSRSDVSPRAARVTEADRPCQGQLWSSVSFPPKNSNLRFCTPKAVSLALHISLRGALAHKASLTTQWGRHEGICIRQLCRMELEGPSVRPEALLRITQMLHLISYQKTVRRCHCKKLPKRA